MVVMTILILTPVKAQQENAIFDVSSASLFSNDDEFLKVDEAFVFNFYQNKNILEVNFDIAEGYYLYRHQFKFKSNDARFLEVKLPTGTDHEDEFFGVQKVFTESLAFSVNIEQANANDSLKITYQGCAEKGLCYPPTTKIVQLSEITPTTISDSNQQGSPVEAAEVSSKSEQHQLSDMLKQESLLLTLIAFFCWGIITFFYALCIPNVSYLNRYYCWAR
jgi:thiol:disulfide interchange protein DsbD